MGIRTIGRRFPRRTTGGVTRQTCRFCGAEWHSNDLHLLPSGLLSCYDCHRPGDRDAVELGQGTQPHAALRGYGIVSG